eukprot:NODE_1037_length_1929_cov_117.942414_g986_i0.p1 GENE.NODE_1037_length_1929_cov_117.942414_g986_i0~~NODE_1037_length_1929_cov_117.942414_g986_i0.p1  ORF type:complete len:574 (-),score=112.17 NODE_1037_length_1929_cov_117.942414_g986_i0:137-1858(-)
MPVHGEHRDMFVLFNKKQSDFAIDVEPTEAVVSLMPADLKARLRRHRNTVTADSAALSAATVATTPSVGAPTPKALEKPKAAAKEEDEDEEEEESDEEEKDPDTPVVTKPSSTRDNRAQMGAGTVFVALEDKPDEAEEEDQGDVLAFPPWMKSNYQFKTQHLALHEEMVDWLQYMKPRKAERALRNIFVHKLVQMLTKGPDALFPEATVHVFGSLRTDLLLPSSDVDICVTGVTSCTDNQALDRIASRLQMLDLAHEAPKVIGAKVKIVKFAHKLSKIECDISINSIGGRHNTQMVSNLLDCFPQSRPLILIIKTFLRQRKMNEVFSGGLSSYSISLMVIHMLQMFHANDKVKPSLGKLLIDFFHLYGHHYNYDLSVISVRDGGCYLEKRQFPACTAGPAFKRQGMRLAIQDPQNDGNDVSGGSREMQQIRVAFYQAYLSLTSKARPPTGSEIHAEHKNIFKRPTLLNRVLNVDKELLIRRDALEGMYEEYLDGTPDAAEEEDYESDYDEAEMSAINPLSPLHSPTSPMTPVSGPGTPRAMSHFPSSPMERAPVRERDLAFQDDMPPHKRGRF